MRIEAEGKSAGHLDFWVLLATILAPSMVFMVSTALGVALPAIQRDLQASGTDLIWIVNAYSLLQAAFIFLSGAFGDHYGRKRFYLLGIALFGLASLACGLARSAETLILARALQGIGSGMMITCSLAIVGAFFAHHRRSEAIGLWSGFVMLITGAGPILGGWLSEIGLWSFIFFINIPLSLLTILVVLRYVPESYDEDAPRQLDISGTVLSTLALLLSGYFCIEGARRGFSDPLVLLSGLAAGASLLAFVWIEGHSDHPMMPLNLFRSRTFTGANTLTLLIYGTMNSALFFLPIRLIQVQGYSESAVGLALLPLTIFMVALSFVMGRIVDRYGPRLPLTVGPLLMSLSFALFAMLGLDSGQASYWTTLFPGVCLLGAGMGLTLAPLTTAVMASVDEHHAGIASGLNNTVSRSAQVLALAIMGSGLLVLFQDALLEAPLVQALPRESRLFLADEAVRLAEMNLPPELSAAQQTALRRVIREAFSAALDVIMVACAALTLLSSLLAIFLIERELAPE